MRANSLPIVLAAACLLMPLDCFAGSPAKRAEAPAAAIDPQTLAKVVPGISKAQVKSLLGEPWRTVQYNDLDEVENEFWEYRGQDSQGTYRVHIEFDKNGAVLIVGKIPDQTPDGRGTPAKS
jgi:outer membrane protein assembly factor BamE (lipoprotein component of BamABCDE complex)